MHVLARMASEEDQWVLQGMKLKHFMMAVSGPETVIPRESPVHLKNCLLKLLKNRHGQINGQKAVQQGW